jgi:hypothetical protein
LFERPGVRIGVRPEFAAVTPSSARKRQQKGFSQKPLSATVIPSPNDPRACVQSCFVISEIKVRGLARFSA